MTKHPYDYTTLLKELNDLACFGKGHRLTSDEEETIVVALEAIKSLQSRVETLTPLVRRARSLIAEAMDIHIYNEADGELPGENCQYAAFLKDADVVLNPLTKEKQA